MRSISTLKGELFSALFTLSLLSACTLDFEEFDPYTRLPEPPPEPDIFIMIDDMMLDQAPPDALVDMAPPPDSDGDGVVDDEDNCPELANEDQADFDGDMIGDLCDDDLDGDEISNEVDNCPLIPNTAQRDLDGDLTGDLCDDDLDGDTRPDLMEAALGQRVGYSDSDGDGISDGEDPCPGLTDWSRFDLDGDGLAAACDADDDGDGVLDWRDNCPGHGNPDQAPAEVSPERGALCVEDYDGDGIVDSEDACPLIAGEDARCGLAIEGDRALFESAIRALAAQPTSIAAGSAGALMLFSADGRRQATLSAAEGLDQVQVERVYQRNDAVWLLAAGQPYQLRRLPGALEARPHLEPLPLATLGLTDGEGAPLSVSALAFSGEALWLATELGLYVLNSEGAEQVELGSFNPEVVDLWSDPEGRIWALERAGLTLVTIDPRGSTPVTTPAEIGVPARIHSEGGRVWLIGDLGAAEVDVADPESLLAVYTGQFQSLTSRPSGLYLSDGEGLTWVDQSGRVSGTQRTAIPERIAALARVGDESWVGSGAGLFSFAGQWFPVEALGPLSCLYGSVSVGDYLWLATSGGVQRLNREGILEALQETNGAPAITLERQEVGERAELWVGREGELLRFDEERNLVATHGPADGLPAAPLVDIERDEETIWLAFGGESGRLLWSTLASLEAGEPVWNEILPQPDGALFRSGNIRSIARSGERLWVATDDGLCAFTLADRSPSVCYGVNDWIYLRSGDVLDVSAYGDRVSAATENGVAVTTDGGLTWIERRRGENEIPITAGTNRVESIADSGAGLWLKLGVSERYPQGALVFLPNDPEAGLAPGELFSPADYTLPLTAQGSSRLRFSESVLTLTSCGEGGEEGGIARLDGPRVATRARLTEGLAALSEKAALLTGPEGDTLWVSVASDGRPLIQRVSAEGVSVIDPGILSEPPRDCVWQPDTERLVCLLWNNQLAYYRGSWTLNDNEVFRDTQVQVVELPRRERLSPWYGTRDGLYDGLRTKFNQASSGGVLPSNDIRALYYDLNEDKLYIGTAAGVAIYQPSANSWSPVEETLQQEIVAIEADQQGDIWVAATGQLFQLVAGQVAERWRLSDGLPEVPLVDLARGPSGGISLLSASGLHRYAEGRFESSWRVEGLPVGARALVGGSALTVYGESGLLRLTPPVIDERPPEEGDGGMMDGGTADMGEMP